MLVFFKLNSLIIHWLLIVNRFEDIQTVVVEFDAVEPLVRLEVVKFETEPFLIAGATAAGATGGAFDGHAAGSLGGGGGGPRLYGDGTSHSKKSTGTSNAAGREVDMNDKTKSSYKVKADVKLREVYPSTEGKILHTHVLPPVVGGQAVSATPAKYASAISATTDITVNNKNMPSLNCWPVYLFLNRSHHVAVVVFCYDLAAVCHYNRYSSCAFLFVFTRKCSV